MTFNFKSHPDWICSGLGHKSGLLSLMCPWGSFQRGLTERTKLPWNTNTTPECKGKPQKASWTSAFPLFCLLGSLDANTQPLPPLLYFRPLSVSPINLLTCKVFLLRYLIIAIRKTTILFLNKPYPWLSAKEERAAGQISKMPFRRCLTSLLRLNCTLIRDNCDLCCIHLQEPQAYWVW